MIVGGVAFQVNMVICAALMLIYVMRRNGATKSGLELLEPDSASSNNPFASASVPQSIPLRQGGKTGMEVASSRVEASVA